MPIYALWNNKGGVGKSYLTFQIASEYARTHPKQKILVIDICPQANSSSMFLGGMSQGELNLDKMASASPKLTIAGYIEERIRRPYESPSIGSQYVVHTIMHNGAIPSNLYLLTFRKSEIGPHMQLLNKDKHVM